VLTSPGDSTPRIPHPALGSNLDCDLLSDKEQVIMPIPDYQTVMLPLLKVAGDGKEHHIRDAINNLAAQFGLTEEDRKELLPSGVDRIFDNRIGWARTYLKKAALIEYPKRGFFQITERGKKILGEAPSKINIAFLKQFLEFVEF
jgi:restriction system protein